MVWIGMAWGAWRISDAVVQAACTSLALRRSRLARPPIWRLSVFSFEICPSVYHWTMAMRWLQVARVLVPELSPGDVVVMDLPAHRVAGISEAIEAAGARLLNLPPYSPDFNSTPSSTPSPS